MSKRQAQFTTKSVKYFSDRGNDKYLPNQDIRIKIDPASCPLLNPLESYLRFSFKIPESAGGSLVPDPKLKGAMVIETLSIYDGTESVLIEEINNLDQLEAVKAHYNANRNTDHLHRVFRGFASDNNAKLTATNSGGGINSVYIQREEPNVSVSSYDGKEVEVIYRLDCSGILGGEKVVPLIQMNGLVIRASLRDAKKVLVECRVDGVGKGRLNADGTQSLDLAGSVYALDGFFDAGGVIQAIPVGGIPTGTTLTGLIFKDTASATINPIVGNGVVLDDYRNFPAVIGQTMQYMNNTNGSTAGVNDKQSTTTAITEIVSNVGGGTRIGVRFPAHTTATPGQDVPQDACACASVASNPTYEVSNLEYVASVVETEDTYLRQLASQVSSGSGLNFQFHTYQDYPVNIQQVLQNEVYIPATQRRSFSVMSVPETLGETNTNNSNYTPSVAGLSEYQYVINGKNIPTLPVSLARVAVNRVNPLHLIEQEKTLDQTSIEVKNLINNNHMFFVGRSLGRYNNSFNLNENSLRLRLNYSANSKSQIIHNYIYHIRTLNITPNGRVVVM